MTTKQLTLVSLGAGENERWHKDGTSANERYFTKPLNLAEIAGYARSRIPAPLQELAS